mmetsp:Transcript_39944/g.93895  ORF Transcript_39944/g.93895 Transcript_39944/m.93895 type:complete len:465 (-) Transcript_39944:45-1439(-)
MLESWIGRDTVFGVPIDDIFSYRTNKVVRIQDRWVGVADLILRTIIILFTIFVLLIGQRGYLEYESVVGSVSTRISGGVQGVNISTADYCQGEIGCRLVDKDTVFRSGPDQKAVLVSTVIHEREQERVCDEDAKVCKHRSPFATIKEEMYYTAGVDEMELIIEHEAMAPTWYMKEHEARFAGHSTSMRGRLVSFRDDGTGRNETVDLREIDPTVGLRVSVSDMLDAAGLSLDGMLPGQHEPIRKTGVLLYAFITYTNTHTAVPPARKLEYTVEFAPAGSHLQGSAQCSEYDPVGFGAARMMVKRSGVRVVLVQQGRLGRFSLLALLHTLAAGFFITALAAWVMAQIVTRWIPLAERYEAAKYEYTENINNIRQSMNIYSDQVLEAGTSVADMLGYNSHKRGYGAVGGGEEMSRVPSAPQPASRLQSAHSGHSTKGVTPREDSGAEAAGGTKAKAQRAPQMYPQQ